MAGRAKENLPGGSLKYLLVYWKVRIFKCSYRIYTYIYYIYMCLNIQRLNGHCMAMLDGCLSNFFKDGFERVWTHLNGLQPVRGFERIFLGCPENFEGTGHMTSNVCLRCSLVSSFRCKHVHIYIPYIGLGIIIIHSGITINQRERMEWQSPVSNSAQLVHLRSWQPRVPQDSWAAWSQERQEVTRGRTKLVLFRCFSPR